MLSGVVIEAGLIALLRVLAALAGASISWGILLMGFGALNMLVGNLMALRQTQVKRMLAYSSLSHIGYMVLGLGSHVCRTGSRRPGGLFHLLNQVDEGLLFAAGRSCICCTRKGASR
jgi:formate hydrogenlyase subunit 3/multisubunit Na+/H+ antiporter MnhD subunit